jgi:hypothetical protein
MDGNWHLVAGTYDGASLRMYGDGVQVFGSGSPTNIAINYAPNTNFYIGSYVAPLVLCMSSELPTNQTRLVEQAGG